MWPQQPEEVRGQREPHAGAAGGQREADGRAVRAAEEAGERGWRDHDGLQGSRGQSIAAGKKKLGLLELSGLLWSGSNIFYFRLTLDGF